MGETLMESKLNGIVGWKDFDDQIVKQGNFVKSQAHC